MWGNEDEMDFSILPIFKESIKVVRGDGKYFKKYYETKEEFRKDFREKSLMMHPDKGGDEEEFKKFINVYGSIMKRM
jgi:hypothetical protein